MGMAWHTYGEERFVVLLGGLHIGVAGLTTLGDFFEGNGWMNGITQADVAGAGMADCQFSSVIPMMLYENVLCWMCFTFFLANNEGITFSVNFVMLVIEFISCTLVVDVSNITLCDVLWTPYLYLLYLFPKWTIIRKRSSYSVILLAANRLLLNCLCRVRICLDLIQYLYTPITKSIHSFAKCWFGHFQQVITIRLLP